MSEEQVTPSLRQKHIKQLMKTEMCKFFLSNRCGKGNRCAFAHSVSEIREKPNLNRTSMCRSFLQSGNCDNPSCLFAHSEQELRTTTGFFKTKICRFAASGRCKHGASCRFAHTSEELKDEADIPTEAAASNSQALGQMTAEEMRQNRSMGLPSSGDEAMVGGQRVVSIAEWANMQSDQSSSPGEQVMPQDLSSDQSTRADTTASVPTPEGSGDSGQEESHLQPHMTRRGGAGENRAGRAGDRRSGERHSGRQCTTVMLTNVPNFLTQGALVSLLEDLTVCMRGAFDFFYCPWDPYEDQNLGYAIINFYSRTVAVEFERQWANQPLLPRTHGSKQIRIVPAALQGRAANLRHFSGFSLAHHADPRFRPLVRAGPTESLRPMAIATEMTAGSQRPQASASQQDSKPVRPAAAANVGMAAARPPQNPQLSSLCNEWPNVGQLASASAHDPLGRPMQDPGNHPLFTDTLLTMLASAQQKEAAARRMQGQHQQSRMEADEALLQQHQVQQTAGVWNNNMTSNSYQPFVIVQPGTETNWMADAKQQESLAKLPGPSQDDMPMQPCWALVMPPGANGATPCNAGSMGGMAGVGGCMGPKGADGTGGASARNGAWGLPPNFFMNEFFAGQANSS